MRDRAWWDAAYRLIDEERGCFPVTFMCKALGIVASGYYRWRDRPPSQRDRDDAALCRAIQRIYHASEGSYGVRRVHWSLLNEGFEIGFGRVQRLMQRMGLAGLMPRRRRLTTTSSGGRGGIPDLVERDFAPAELDRLWVADATYLMTTEGPLFLAVVMDSASRRILGWALSPYQTAELMCDALSMALVQRPRSTGNQRHAPAMTWRNPEVECPRIDAMRHGVHGSSHLAESCIPATINITQSSAKNCKVKKCGRN